MSIAYTIIISMSNQPKKPKGSFMDDAYTLLQPIRFELINLLTEKPQHVNGLAKALGQERRLVAQHLEVLEAYGFVTSKRALSEEPSSLGRGLLIYQVTDKVAEVKKKLKKML
jgi:predicted ArsR family transcriptional regulator